MTMANHLVRRFGTRRVIINSYGGVSVNGILTNLKKGDGSPVQKWYNANTGKEIPQYRGMSVESVLRYTGHIF